MCWPWHCDCTKLRLKTEREKHSNSINRKAELYLHFSAALSLESVQKVCVCVCVCLRERNKHFHLRREEKVGSLMPWCVRTELRTAHSRKGSCSFKVCMLVCVWICLYSRVFVPCKSLNVCIGSLDKGAVAAAGSTSCVFVGELDCSAVVLALP